MLTVAERENYTQFTSRRKWIYSMYAHWKCAHISGVLHIGTALHFGDTYALRRKNWGPHKALANPTVHIEISTDWLRMMMYGMRVYFVDAAFCSSSSILDSYTNGLKHAYRIVRLEKSHGIDVCECTCSFAGVCIRIELLCGAPSVPAASASIYTSCVTCCCWGIYVPECVVHTVGVFYEK